MAAPLLAVRRYRAAGRTWYSQCVRDARKRATTQGAVLSIVLGVGTWLAFLSISSLAELFPAQLAGLIAALIGMFAGTLLPQAIADKKGHVHHFTGSTSQ